MSGSNARGSGDDVATGRISGAAAATPARRRTMPTWVPLAAMAINGLSILDASTFIGRSVLYILLGFNIAYTIALMRNGRSFSRVAIRPLYLITLTLGMTAAFVAVILFGIKIAFWILAIMALLFAVTVVYGAYKLKQRLGRRRP